MAWRMALYTAGCCAVVFGYFRVKALCDGVDIFAVLHRHQNGVAQKLVALDMGGHAYLVQNFRHGALIIHRVASLASAQCRCHMAEASKGFRK